MGAPNHHLVEIDITDKKPGKDFEVVVPVSNLLEKNESYEPYKKGGSHLGLA